LGLNKYYTGKPCPYNHDSERYVIGCKCVTCAVNKAMERNRENRKRTNKANNKYYHRNKERIQKQRKEYRVHNPEKVKQQRKREYERNKTIILERHKEYYQRTKTERISKKRKYRKENPEAILASNQKWLANNPGKQQEYDNRRRARENNAIGDHTEEDIQWLLEKQNWKCVYCKKSLKDGYHRDHYNPLSRGGDNSRDNLQMVCPHCNHSKGPKDPIVFAQENGLLL